VAFNTLPFATESISPPAWAPRPRPTPMSGHGPRTPGPRVHGSAGSLLWFAVFGGAGFAAQRDGLDVVGQGTREGQLFAVLGQYPLVTVATVVVMLLVGIFFVSGADAASIVMGSLSQRRTLEPSRWVVVFWGVHRTSRPRRRSRLRRARSRVASCRSAREETSCRRPAARPVPVQSQPKAGAVGRPLDPRD
jgi:hypothetical protein